MRFLHAFALHPAAELDRLVPEAAGLLHTVSVERQRDEFLKVLALPAASAACRQLRGWGLEAHILPEMTALAGVSQSLPHLFDVYEHTLATLEAMARIDRLLRGDVVATGAWEEGMMAALAPHAAPLRHYLERELATGQPCWVWLRLAALAHDWGKPAARSVDEDGRIRFFGHEALSADLIEAWALRFHCPAATISFLRQVCAGHMRPHLLHNDSPSPSRRTLYRFYRHLDAAAPAVILLAMADQRGAAGPHMAAAAWDSYLAFAAVLFAAGLEGKGEALSPRPLLTGHDLMALFDLRPAASWASCWRPCARRRPWARCKIGRRPRFLSATNCFEMGARGKGIAPIARLLYNQRQ